MASTEREFEGRDLAEALKMASEALGIPEPDLDYKMLEQGRRGLFGLGAKPVRIRVMPPVRGVAEAGPTPETRAKKNPVKGAARKNNRRNRKNRNSRPRPAPPQAGAARRPRPESGPDVEATVSRMVELMGLELDVSARAVDGGVAVDLGGADRKLLLHKDGELISAMQFLLNRMARRAWPGTGRIHLSCDGNREQRDEDLVELTREAARNVVDSGRAQRLQPMNAYERRLVHITVREFPELDSRSEGNGFLKRVRIFKRG